tara:strand:- start:445 stop:2214 length:1770 start_codon:yes stop_codon:yes gene_type:complete
MKISRLLNKKNFLFFLFFIFYTYVFANEPVDIWNIDKTTTENNIDQNTKENIATEEIKEDAISVYNLNSQNSDINRNQVLLENNLDDEVSLYGLYDPDVNNLSLQMWNESNGIEIKKIFDKILSLNLSEDAMDILEIALMTNSTPPVKNISSEDFYNFQKQFLIKKNDLNLIKLFIEKNPNFLFKDELINYYANYYIAEANIEKSCEIFDMIEDVTINDQYALKIKIYCLVNSNKIEEALLIYELKKEMGLEDNFFESKIFKLIGIENESDQVSDKNLLEFHLSHRAIENFEYLPNENTSKDVWKYLQSANLLEDVENIDLDDIEKINLIEKAAHEGNYKEVDLFSLYTRYQFNFNQLLSAKENYKTLGKPNQRALIYQKMLLTVEPNEKLYLARLLKNLFEADNLSNAFNYELSNILISIDETKLTSDLISFYEDNIINENSAIKKIKFNNKIIHQSKLLNYFVEKKEIPKIEKETNDLLQNILKDKKYVITTSDEILLESLKYDGVKILKKYSDRYSSTANIPPDIQVKINNRELGMILLRISEIIGEDKLENLGSETLNFILITLNQLDLDTIRDKIILKTLPMRV